MSIAAALLLHAATGHAHRAVLLIAPDTGAVLHAEQANIPSHPASLTKMMTVYLLLEALDAGRLALDDLIAVSEDARSQAPRKLGLKAGTRVKLGDMLYAVVVSSANDAAVVVAEAVAGSEAAFVSLMNDKAAALGMNDTRFTNASGLPDPAQITTARDMAVLAVALQRDFPDRYQLFSTRSFDYRGRHYETHNNFLRAYPGADGLKTGFTCRAGYNLVASATRDGRRLIGVVLGSPTAGSRDARMTRLFDTMFTGAPQTTQARLASLREAPGQGADAAINADFIAEECIHPRRDRGVHKVARWSLEIGVEVEKQAAIDTIRAFIREHRHTLRGGRPLLIPRLAQSIIYRIGVTDLEQADATATCLQLRERDQYCLVLTPEAAASAVKQAMQVIKLGAE